MPNWVHRLRTPSHTRAHSAIGRNRWLTQAITADPSELSYTVISHTHRTPGESSNTSIGGTYGSRAWKAGTRAKVAWVQRLTGRFTADTIFLVTDLDVMPLRPLDALVRWFLQQRTAEVAFMREPGRTIGTRGVQWTINTGFFLLRNTKEALIGPWVVSTSW